GGRGAAAARESYRAGVAVEMATTTRSAADTRIADRSSQPASRRRAATGLTPSIWQCAGRSADPHGCLRPRHSPVFRVVLLRTTARTLDNLPPPGAADLVGVGWPTGWLARLGTLA